MNLRRLRDVAWLDFRENLTRPLFWTWLIILAFVSWGLSNGNVRIQSGDSSVGGMKAWMTSEFAVAQVLSFLVLLLHGFFIAVLAGMTILRDDELKVGEVLHATRLTPSEYVWAKFSAALGTSLLALLANVLFMAFFHHLVPNARADEIRGPFSLSNYLVPALTFGVPTVALLAGTSFALGGLTRRPILVFFSPLALFIICGFFLWDWSPTWLDVRIDRALQFIDPTGFRWLNQTWLEVDRGVVHYNTKPVGVDALFFANRLVCLLIGLGSVAFTAIQLGHTVRGASGAKELRRAANASKSARGAAVTEAASSLEEIAAQTGAAAVSPPVSSLGMGVRAASFFRSVRDVVVFELAGLATTPGLYLFAPLILIQILGTSLIAVGAFDTPLLVTSGVVAVRTMNTITLLVCFLILFYMVEALQRERNTNLAPIFYATPVPTAALLVGKALANSVVGVVISFAAFIGCAIAILIQGKAPLELGPFFLVWGVLLFPTFFLWASFVGAAHTLARNRYTAYAIGLGALVLTGWVQLRGKMSWVGNWDLWSVLLWSDMGPLALDRAALLWNRLAAVSLTALFIAIGVRFFPRKEADATRTLHRLSGPSIRREIWLLLPFLILPAVSLIVLGAKTRAGFQGPAVEKKAKDYWRRNLATWRDAPNPALTRVDLDLQLDPAKHWFRSVGTYTLQNHLDQPMWRFALTGGLHWKDVKWTWGGEDYSPEERGGLYVFTPDARLAPGDSAVIGFRFEGKVPDGLTKNGGGVAEFILPSGVVLTSFRPTFVPVVGYDESVGVDDKNRYEQREYPPDHYQKSLAPAFGSRIPSRTRVKVSGPPEYTYNSVGVLTSDETIDGQRVMTWESDHPVRFFNVVAAKWATDKRDGTEIYYHPAHTYNIEEMSVALAAARKYYSEWFRPFPWATLKLSEFPAMASYAQGFPTNITFSEGIGFLTKSDPKTNAAFLVTAHEAAHQWWGNLLTPAEGPGGNILSEGMSHFSTMLLIQQVKGERERMEFAKRIEERYGDARVADSERPLTRIDGSRNGDETATYDKGGWVFWMLHERMGREASFAAHRKFMLDFGDGPDYPLLEDYVAALRPFAPDSTAFDEYVQQWFFEVVAPRYRLADVTMTREGDEWRVAGKLKNEGTGRMPIEIAAARGERFPAASAAGEDAYVDARTTVLLAAGEEVSFSISAPFEPKEVVVDPDVRVLQLQRKYAVYRF